MSRRGSRVLRGGSWSPSVRLVRVAFRNNNTPTNTNNNGFRCAKTFTESLIMRLPE
ncbi:MAG: SUMF1/EgtB/PvdO family nonheme iron enzyme [Candidatus Poribacteria bacterium]|nr:SUMF1/EgtB/PvdO family nonheme iron enzyme [Candidatus Poribacteria bacterium]